MATDSRYYLSARIPEYDTMFKWWYPGWKLFYSVEGLTPDELDLLLATLRSKYSSADDECPVPPTEFRAEREVKALVDSVKYLRMRQDWDEAKENLDTSESWRTGALNREVERLVQHIIEMRGKMGASNRDKPAPHDYALLWKAARKVLKETDSLRTAIKALLTKVPSEKIVEPKFAWNETSCEVDTFEYVASEETRLDKRCKSEYDAVRRGVLELNKATEDSAVHWFPGGPHWPKEVGNVLACCHGIESLIANVLYDVSQDKTLASEYWLEVDQILAANGLRESLDLLPKENLQMSLLLSTGLAKEYVESELSTEATRDAACVTPALPKQDNDTESIGSNEATDDGQSKETENTGNGRGRRTTIDRDLELLNEFEKGTKDDEYPTQAYFAEQKGMAPDAMNKALKRARDCLDLLKEFERGQEAGEYPTEAYFAEQKGMAPDAMNKLLELARDHRDSLKE